MSLVGGRLFVAAVSVATCISLGALAAPALADVAPYGANDAGGFRNVLPPGENGLDNALQLAAFQAGGTLPPHAADQLHLYTDLIYGADNLTHDQIPNYYKDATFGVKAADVESTESPRSDVTIIRDKAYGVPHIYGTTRAGVMYGAGYAAGEDRLFLIDVLRHTGRAELSSFIGGSAGNQAMDATQWTIAPYTEADLQSQVDSAPKLYGARGQELVDDATNYVAGLNAYVAAAMLDPTKLPGEYAAIGKTPQPFTVTDVIAEASLIGGIFGKGGGNEIRSALTEQSFEARFGKLAGRRSWMDFRSKNDPEAPTTLSTPFPYEDGSPFSTRGLAMPDPGSTSFIAPDGTVTKAGPTPISDPRSGGRQAALKTHTPVPIAIPDDGSIGSQLLHQMLAGPPLASNWELVSARHSANGHAIGVLGPQVGYYVPQILMEEDLHGPGIDARGASFPGVNQYVELGHGRDYAWSATTATSDNVDTFAEVLCQDDFHYMYKGQCVAMERLDRTNSWTPNASDNSAPGSATLTAYRTAHGIVIARGTVNGGTKVAFTSARTTYFHEADSALGFAELNDPNFVTGPQQFQKAASDINFLFNWGYVDANHIAYYHSGALPQRADGASPDFPTLGTGGFDWKGYDAASHTQTPLPYAQHPNAVDPNYMVSWNNKQAPLFSAADDKYSFSSIYRSQMIEAGIKRALAGGGKMRIEQLISAMDEAATTDIRAFALWPILKKVLGTPSDPRLADAVAKLDAWAADGGHRRDLNNRDITKGGVYQHNDAITIMDAWYPKLVEAIFRAPLGDDVVSQLRQINDYGSIPAGAPASGYPDFADGWYGYVSKDLRDVLARAAAPVAPKPRCRFVRRRIRAGAHRGRLRRVRVCAKPAKPKPAKRHLKRHAKRPLKAHRAPSAPMPAGAYSRMYCGGGSLSACRALLQSSLLSALSVTPQQIYGNGGRCASDPQASCYDMNTSVIAGGISIPPFPFQNRPTFQQVVELTQTLPR